MKPLDAYNPWHWIAFLAVLWWSLAGGLFMFANDYLLPLFVHGDHGRFLAFWVTAAANEWLVSAIVLLALNRSATSLHHIGVEWSSRRATVCFATLTAVLVVAILIRPERNASGTFPGMPPNGVARAMMPWTHSDRLFMVLIMSSTAAVCEEMIYRGFTLAFLRSMIGLWPAVILQAALFAYMHGGRYQGLGGFLFRFPGGLLFAVLAIWRGNLRAVMGVHFVTDAVFFALG